MGLRCAFGGDRNAADVARTKKSRASSRESRCLHLGRVHGRRIATLSRTRKNLVVQDESMQFEEIQVIEKLMSLRNSF